MAPRIELQLLAPQDAYSPGDSLRFRIQLEGVEAEEVAAVETSVLWHTEGKGDEDLGVHFFQRLTADQQPDLRGPAEHRLPLPNSPLSYEGAVVKIRWCVRVRAFLRKPWKGPPLTEELPLRLLARRGAEGRP